MFVTQFCEILGILSRNKNKNNGARIAHIADIILQTLENRRVLGLVEIEPAILSLGKERE